MGFSETTVLQLINAVRELKAIVERQRSQPGPLTYDELAKLRKADELRSTAISEAKLAGILPHAITKGES